MNPSEEQIEEIFCAAMEIEDAGRRKAFIVESCAGNERLQAAVDGMFLLQQKANGFFSDPSPVLGGIPPGLPILAEANPSAVIESGQCIGPYRLVECLGEGGCGVVFLAEQSAPIRRQVALKVIKLGMDTRSVIARFEAERQTLALMDHPGIARVLDAGATAAGRPYFVMELVRGMKITRYCDQQRLSTTQRLNLFIQVCLAIQHAHQKGIIHRDIKPSNVLITSVDGEPVPKVIDFGIAKATNDQSLGDNTVFTARDQFIGTPAYMSPEQATLNGLDVDTRSDIYSLGVLLYELLTGRTPFDQSELLQEGLDEMRRKLRDKDPHRPSARLERLDTEELTQTAVCRQIEPHRLKLMLRGDLDWIVMKALEKDRNRRYQTVNGLAMDVRRYLGHEVVTARPPSRLYQFRKMARRNRPTFVAATVTLLALILGLGVSTWSFLRERDARREQANLRQEADARARIAQAAVFISRNRQAEADQLVDQIRIPVLEPSLEAAGVFRALGNWNALQGRWGAASARFLKLLEANQVDKSDLTDEATRDLTVAGPALLAAGDSTNYSAVVRQSIARFSGTRNPVAAEQVIKISTLVPIDGSTIEALAPLAEVLEQSMQSSPRQRWQTRMAAWQTVSLAMYEYRRGNWGRAEAWARKCLDYPDAPLPQTAICQLILAMSLNQQHQPERGWEALEEARRTVAPALPEKLERIPEFGNEKAGYWHDWVIAYLLLGEASRSEK